MTNGISPDAIRLKRAYEPAAPGDGTRVLVDRLWPRGIGKEAAAIDRWAREIAPSTALRKWVHEDTARFEAFRERYAGELRSRSADLEALRELARQGTLTLVFAARDPLRNNAAVLREILLGG